jgi:long-chain fatty acid transport protein
MSNRGAAARCWWWVVLVAAATFLLAQPAPANPPDTYGLGARSTSLGSAVAASSTDFSAGYYNPAGFASGHGSELALGYSTVAHRLKISGRDSRVDPVRGVVGGLIARGAAATVPVAVGISTRVSDDRLSRFRTRRPDSAHWLRYEDRPQLLYLSVGAAMQPLPWLSVGGGAAMLSATTGSFRVTGTAIQPDGRDRSANDSQLRHEVDIDLTPRSYPLLGLRATPADWVSWALVYRGQATVDFDVRGEFEGEVETVAFTVPAAYEVASRAASAFIPRQVVFGIELTPTEVLAVELDLTYLNWSAYRSPFSHTDSRLEVAVPPGLLDLPPETRPSLALDPHFQDRIVPRVGVEWWLRPHPRFALPIRVGYFFEKSPVPEQTAQSNFVDPDRHVLSAGTGFLWRNPAEWLPGRLSFAAFGQLSILPTRVTLKQNPADFVGDYRARGTITAAGADLSLEFP